MDNNKIELLLEAEKRGILPQDKQELLGEARKRGLVQQTERAVYATDIASLDPTEDMTGSEKFWAGMGKAFVDTGRGVKQLASHVGIGDREAIQREIDEAKELEAPLMNTGAGMAGNVLGHVALTLAPGKLLAAGGKALSLPSMVRAGNALNNVNTVKGAAAFGAGYNAIQPVASDESRTVNAALGAAGGAGGQVLGKTIGRVMKPVRSTISGSASKVAQQFENMGGQLTPGQRTGSTALRQIEAGMESFPPTAGAMAKIKDNNQTVLNRVAAKAIGENADDLSESVLGRAYTRIGNKFNFAKGGSVQLGDDFLNGLAKIDNEYQSVWGGKGDAAFKSLMDDALDDTAKGTISGERYTRLRSDLSKRARDAFSQQNSRLGQAIDDMIEALDDAAQKSLPQGKAKVLAEARKQWATLRTLEKSMSGENVSGSKLASQLRKKDPKGFTYGFKDNDLYTAARFADRFKPLVGDSGTATRMGVQMLGGGIAGSGVAALTGHDPMTGLAYGVGAPLALRGAQGVYLSRPIQRYLSTGLLDMSPAVEQGLLQGAKGTGLALPLLVNDR